MRGRGFLAAALVLALVPWGAQATLPVDPVTGDTVVTEDTTVQNETIAPDKNLTIMGFSTLTLIDCKIVMKPDTVIWVASNLVMRNVSISCTDPGPRYDFVCWGRLSMDNCNVSGSNSWRLNVWSHDCSITNSTFSMSGAGIAIENGTPLLRGNRFMAGEYMYYYTPTVNIRNSSPVLECNTFCGPDRHYEALEVSYPASPLVSNNTFLNCSIGLMYYYIHQHAEGGTVSPSPGEPARFIDNTFTDCGYGIITSDSPGGNGQGRSNGEPRALQTPDPVFIATGNLFQGNDYGIQANGEAPSVIERCEFRDNGEGVLQSYTSGMRVANSTFTNQSFGLRTYEGDLSLCGCTFRTNDRNLLCHDTIATVEGNKFFGGRNTSISLTSYAQVGSYFANNFVNGGYAPGLRIEGTAVVFNNTFWACPFGIYRAIRQYGQGHGRDIGQGPPPVQDMAVIRQNVFGANGHGIYSEGWSDIADNNFTWNHVAGVEVSYFIHPEDSGNFRYLDNGIVDRFTVERNNFSNNTAGVLLLGTNYYGDDNGQRLVSDNLFANNTFGIDMIYSEANCTSNDFSRNGGWAFRQIESESETSDNRFGGCDRVRREGLYSVYVYEPPEDDPDAPYNEYQYSDRAWVRVTARSGVVIYSGRTEDGQPLFYPPDDFDRFYSLNLTTEMVLANGSVLRTSPVEIEAWKPGKGVADTTVDLNTTSNIDLYLQPTPDIVVRDFNFTSSNAVAGERLTGNFTVSNDNTYDPANVSLQDVAVELALDGAVVQTMNIPWLLPGVPEKRDIEWTATPGNHTWTVTADPLGQYRELRRDNNRAEFRLDVNGRPLAVIRAEPVGGLTSEPINFSGAGSRDDGAVVAFRFDFGDGTVSEWSGNATAVHSYNKAGDYKARIKVRDDLGLESDWSAPWGIPISNRLPSLTLLFASSEVLTLEPANFTVTASDPEDSSLSVSWDFGDRGRMSGRDLLSVSHEYAGDGCYTVRVTVTDSDTGAASAEVDITVRNRPPVAAFIASPANGTVLTRFSFLSAAWDPDGQVLAYLWDLGDNTSSILDRPLHSYRAPGTYRVSLTVTDDDGASSAPFALTITVENTPPVARARLLGSVHPAGQPLTFDASASFDAETPSVNVSWDFGDGTGATGAVVRHTYTRPGNYTVRVLVTDALGASTEVVLPVVVLGPPSPGEDGWRTTAIGSGLLTLAGAVFLVWVLRNRPKKAPASPPRVVRRVRKGTNFDVYADRLAKSRAERARRENSNRSLYDAMQPVRDGGTGKPGSR